MFRDPTYRDQTMQEMYLFKAKILAVIGAMNARGVSAATSTQMEKTLGVLRGMMDAWEAGDMFEIEIHRFDMGRFREDEDDGLEPFDGFGEHRPANNPPDQPF